MNVNEAKLKAKLKITVMILRAERCTCEKCKVNVTTVSLHNKKTKRNYQVYSVFSLMLTTSTDNCQNADKFHRMIKKINIVISEILQ